VRTTALAFTVHPTRPAQRPGFRFAATARPDPPSVKPAALAQARACRLACPCFNAPRPRRSACLPSGAGAGRAAFGIDSDVYVVDYHLSESFRLSENLRGDPEPFHKGGGRVPFRGPGLSVCTGHAHTRESQSSYPVVSDGSALVDVARLT
jgi:hypothetical protein